MKRFFFIIIAIISVLIGIVLSMRFLTTPTETDLMSVTISPSPPTETIPKQDTEKSKNDALSTNSLENVTEQDTPKKRPVPFILQAPGAKWGNPIFQDGCEEASMLMAISWIRGTESVSPSTTTDEITKLAEFEVNRFGYHEDVDLQEILTVLREYFRYDQAKLMEDITLTDIKTELAEGRIVLTPTHGATLGNPNFTPPGPVTHMLVLTGYDPKTNEFIVNDPGTRRGKKYHYKENVLFDAIWTYPPGMTHPPVPIPTKRTKSIIVIRPTS